jgi:hypothetical protein
VLALVSVGGVADGPGVVVALVSVGVALVSVGGVADGPGVVVALVSVGVALVSVGGVADGPGAVVALVSVSVAVVSGGGVVASADAWGTADKFRESSGAAARAAGGSATETSQSRTIAIPIDRDGRKVLAASTPVISSRTTHRPFSRLRAAAADG